jgi:hypothetical protein
LSEILFRSSPQIIDPSRFWWKWRIVERTWKGVTCQPSTLRRMRGGNETA